MEMCRTLAYEESQQAMGEPFEECPLKEFGMAADDCLNCFDSSAWDFITCFPHIAVGSCVTD